LTGFDELIQQIKIAVGIKKGTFPYDRDLGMESYGGSFTDEKAIKTIEALINESLVNLGGVFVTVNKLSKKKGSYYATITVNNGYTTQDTEVMING
jgi:hypothetical protein